MFCNCSNSCLDLRFILSVSGLSEADRCTCISDTVVYKTTLERSVYFVVNQLCYCLPELEDIDQQIYTDTRSYIFTIVTDVTGNMRASNVLHSQLAAYVHPHIIIVSDYAEIKHCVSCSNLFVYFIILILDLVLS